MTKKLYINDFCYDLNYTETILYVGNVNHGRLRMALEDSVVNKLYRLDYIFDNKDPAKRDFLYIENCDLQDLDFPVHSYIKDGYNVCVLEEDERGFYINVLDN